ncbi:hypothetical protein NQ318_011536 [Aromia moschata]|uniref:Ubiquitin-like domain-containing protein n=1 Tax=Aromia moschata TaxID=1265417 RepID=A0AAV8Z8H1_9CUCU|nr:hypothetical protein NQ318_011536 [Aromia moschata]
MFGGELTAERAPYKLYEVWLFNNRTDAATSALRACRDKFEQKCVWMTPPKKKKRPSQITVKFYTPDSKVFTQSYHFKYTIQQIKDDFVGIFGIPYDNIFLLYNEDVIPDERKLGKLPVDDYGVIELKLLSNDVDHQIHVENVYKNLTVPDILTVSVETDDEGGKGGPPPPKVPHWMKNNRDTQTYFWRNRRTECHYERGTQMARQDLYVTNVTDRIFTAGPYYRAWKMRKCLKELSAEYQKRMRLAREREERERMEDEARKRRDIVSKVFPLTNDDFSMLYSMLEQWKRGELERIASQYCGASKIAECYLVLEKEIDILRSIENVRNKLAKDRETQKILNFFKAIGDPIEWYCDYKNLHIVMDTLETQKGREYFALYKALNDKNLGKNERLEVYCRVREYLSTHECPESEEIINLVDRACTLLTRGMDKRTLNSLQKRIEAMVIHHFGTPECNEGVTMHAKKSEEREMERSLSYCQRCGKLKTINSFTLNARTEKVKICFTCKWLDKSEEPWADLSPYQYILKLIRNYERLHHAVSSVAFILHDRDIHHIVTYIWHGHSALSECNEIYRLRLVRWRVNEEWSPWNCILLTIEEAAAHLRVADLEEVYEEEFRNHIFNKHALAKQQFWQLTCYDTCFTRLAEGDEKLDEHSDFHNKPVHDCLFGPL